MAHVLTWKKLLSTRRAERIDSSGSGIKVDRSYADSDERTPFEQDYDRVIFSAPFRRLARKTQVHPMASNDHIHNRLTHSLEVASVGRSFARRLARLATERSDLSETDADAHTLAWILQSACLIHDLGNPPFGHAGEEVIREWAEEHVDFLFPADRLSPQVRDSCLADWRHFEGNAQGFRFACRADNPVAGYLRLTYATLGAAMKYPWSSSSPKASETSKHSVYSSEIGIFRDMSDKLGLANGSESCRHPLSFLTEAADDICYRIIDLEDAVEMGICEYDKVHELFLQITGNPEFQFMKLTQLRGQAIKSLMNQCWSVFENEFDSIMNGDREDDLKTSLQRECQDQLSRVGEIYNSIFGHRKKVATELGAYLGLSRILNALVKTVQSIDDSQDYSDIHFLAKRTIDLTWGRAHVMENMSQPYSWWLSQVMDYVSGMTDDFATRLSGEIGGFSTGTR